MLAKNMSSSMSEPNSQGFRSATFPNEMRVVLVGKTGVGKSAAGNTILGSQSFESELSPTSVTSECEKARGDVGGRKVAVIDTPGLFDTNLTEEEVSEKIKMCISLSAPGPHAFLVVLQLGRFTEEEKETIKMIQTTFGEDAAKYTIILFTHGDRLEEKTIEDYISKSPDLTAIIEQCCNRYCVFNNKRKDPEQTRKLLDEVDKMIVANGGSYYTNEMLKEAEAAVEKEKQRLLKEMEAEKQRELDVMRAKYEWEIYCREERILQMRYELKARAQAEQSNEFVTAAVAVTVMCAAAGAAAGAAVGAVGGPVGVVVGARVGAAVGAGVGATVGATVGAAGARIVKVKVSERCHVQ